MRGNQISNLPFIESPHPSPLPLERVFFNSLLEHRSDYVERGASHRFWEFREYIPAADARYQ